MAARDAIKCLHLYDKWLFVGGCDPVIRAYDLETGKHKSYEGHLSWVNCMETYIVTNEQGEVKSKWLISGSDDASVRIWNMDTCKPIETLREPKEMKNGVICLAVSGKDLYVGGHDNIVLNYDMRVVERRIQEFLIMEAEDLRSRKAEAMYNYLESKYGKRKGKGKGKGKGKKGKK